MSLLMSVLHRNENEIQGTKKRTARGFLNAANRILPGARSLFQGSSSSQSRQEALLRHVRPELRDTPIAL
jgi:triphosphoribosyl-dephospho-CoA synthetase